MSKLDMIDDSKDASDQFDGLINSLQSISGSGLNELIKQCREREIDINWVSNFDKLISLKCDSNLNKLSIVLGIVNVRRIDILESITYYQEIVYNINKMEDSGKKYKYYLIEDGEDVLLTRASERSREEAMLMVERLKDILNRFPILNSDAILADWDNNKEGSSPVTD